MNIGTISLGKTLDVAIIMSLVGLAVFLVSIKLMSTTLRNFSGRKTKEWILKITDKPLLAIVVGVVFTTIIQSSDGAVALIIGLLAAGMISLRGAIAFVIGANIGTATTSLIVALQSAFSFTNYFLLACFLGALLYMFFKKKNIVQTGFLIFNIGMIFLSLKIMGAGVGSLVKLNQFQDAIGAVGTNIWTSAAFSTGLTALFQSSSATVTLFQALYTASIEVANATGRPSVLTLSSAIAFVFGANVGTTFTAIIVSVLSRNRNSGRIALVWLVSNLSITLLFLPLIPVFYAPIIELIVPNKPGFQMSIAHLSFNGFLTLIFVFFIPELEMLCYRLIPLTPTEKQSKFSLPQNLISSAPLLALVAARNATLKMANMNLNMLKTFEKHVNTKNSKFTNFEDETILIEDLFNKLYRYGMKLSVEANDSEISKANYALIMVQRHLLIQAQLVNETLVHYNNSRKYFKAIRPDIYLEWKESINYSIKRVTKLFQLVIKGIEKPESLDFAKIQKYHLESELANEALNNRFYNDVKILVNDKNAATYEIEYISIIKCLDRHSTHSMNSARSILRTTQNPANINTAEFIFQSK